MLTGQTFLAQTYNRMFLQDDKGGTYFPKGDGTFDTVVMVDRVSRGVCGDLTDGDFVNTM